jgi:methylmalonyl-CoA/ethylmalonyl-CoA epimerase
MSNITKIDHLGIAVPDLQEAIKTYEILLGQTVGHLETVSDQRVNVAFFDVGESHFELLEATDPQSPIARFLERHPKGGLHHICIEVKDIEHRLNEYRDQGIRLIDSEPRLGAHGRRVAFVHPASTGGVLLELSEVVSPET